MKTWKMMSAAVALLAISVLTYLPAGLAQEGKSISQVRGERWENSLLSPTAT